MTKNISQYVKSIVHDTRNRVIAIKKCVGRGLCMKIVQFIIERQQKLRFLHYLLNKSTFACFYLPNSLYYQWLFVSLQRQFSPSLLTMLKSCEAFLFIHIWIWRILFPLQNGLNLQKILLICLNLEVYKFVIETLCAFN